MKTAMGVCSFMYRAHPGKGAVRTEAQLQIDNAELFMTSHGSLVVLRLDFPRLSLVDST